jgi:hypothetical protein
MPQRTEKRTAACFQTARCCRQASQGIFAQLNRNGEPDGNQIERACESGHASVTGGSRKKLNA